MTNFIKAKLARLKLSLAKKIYREGMSILASIDFSRYNINLIGIEDNYPQDAGIYEFLTVRGFREIIQLGCDRFFEKI